MSDGECPMSPSSGHFAKMFVSLALLGAALVAGEFSDHKKSHKVMCYHSLCGNQSIYDFAINDVRDDHAVDWTEYRGKVVLLVNVASF
jgi:hypothetical protein